MASRVFFSFRYEDVKTFRANVVRNHSVTKERGEAGFFDASILEDAKKHGDDAVRRLVVNGNLENTSITCALIGSEMWRRRWVRYELLKIFDRGNPLLGVHINSIRDKNGQVFGQGNNPFDYLGFVVGDDGKKHTYYEHNGSEWRVYQDLAPRNTSYAKEHWGKGFKLSTWAPCHDWIANDGYNNFATWVMNAK